MALFALIWLDSILAVAAASGPEPLLQNPMDCAIHASRHIQLASPIEGVLAEVLVAPGDRVQTGQLIARIDTDIAAADLASAELRAKATGAMEVARVRVRAAEKRYKRAVSAFEQRVITEVDMDDTEAELRVARQALKSEQEGLALARSDAARMRLLVAKGEIRAPAAAVVGEKLLHAGESVRGQAIAELIVVEPMRVEVYAPMSMLAQFQADPGQFELSVGQPPRHHIKPSFDYISPVAETTSNTRRVFYTLTDPRVFPGMRCQIGANPQLASHARLTSE